MELLNNNKQINLKELNNIIDFINSLGYNTKLFNKFFTKTLCILIVPDANTIIGDIIWLTTKRKNKGALTDLMKIAKSGIVKLHVPHVIDKEIKRNIPNIAKQYSINPSLLKTEYQEYKKLFIYNNNMPLKNGKKITTPDTDVINDVIYIKLAIRKKANIYSKDNHIKYIKDKNKNFNIKTISKEEIGLLKDYNNEAIYVTSIEIGGFFLAALATSLIVGFMELVKNKKLFLIIALVLSGIALYLILNKQAKEIVINKVKNIAVLALQKIDEIATERRDKKEKMDKIEKRINLKIV